MNTAEFRIDDFDALWKAAVRFRRVSHDLKTLVFNVVAEAERDPVQADELRLSLDQLLTFLASARGRTDANCCAVDRFFSQFEGTWSRLPSHLASLLDDMSGVLHDAIYAPQIAAHFEALPEQLLDRLRKLP